MKGTGGSVKSFADRSDVVPVFAFDVKITAKELVNLCIRINAVLLIKELAGKTVKIMDDR